ncbi:MarR family winged helix-turn-helix transcriptional regulator [Nakamurella leprariae]|uniref:MarR family transcriptional regulator n=1 Tax=Nakamurella leprariae TaxID=2803911 RepID=A0A938YFQ1_9ACTN|nr:MarR family transcriptional regulator [Nakamurella leprariae]MBM9469039.1 MarR family transcriptional regulator [Nakamurella leprariae]
MDAGPDIPPGQDPLALESQLCFAMVVAARTVVAAYRPVLEPLGLTHPQYLVMLALWQHAPLSVKRLAELLKLEPPTLSPLVKRLEAAGLVTRQRDPDDERVLQVRLTEAGVALRRQAEQVPPTIAARFGMDDADLVRLRDELTAVITASERALELTAVGRTSP